MSVLLRSAERGLLVGCYTRNGMSTSVKAARGMEEFWKKNERLKRPISPHLTIYKPQITTALSISNRGTAAILTGIMYGLPLLYMCGSKDYSAYLDVVKSLGALGTGMICMTKMGLAFCFSFHLFGGIRHLVWDMAIGLNKEMVYKSGLVMLASTAVLTVALLLL